MSFVSFIVPGPLTSNNVAARRVGRRIIANPMAKRDHARVFQIAFAAAHESSWQKPAAASMTIAAFNCRKDVGNIEKAIADGCIGALFTDDSILTELHVTKHLDLEGERYVVTVRACAPLVRPKPLRAMRWVDVRVRDYPRLALSELEATIEAPGCKPMSTVDVPQLWRDRARKALKEGSS